MKNSRGAGRSGNDLFVWNPDDGHDVIEGGAGTDTLLVNGNRGGEIFDLAANGERVLARYSYFDDGLDVNDVEHIAIAAGGGTDLVNVRDLSGTDVKQVSIDFGGRFGRGDGELDRVLALGSNGNDTVDVTDSCGLVSVKGLPARILLLNTEETDMIQVEGGLGNDTMRGSSLKTGTLWLDGGAGNDTLLGSAGADVLLGGDGNDYVDGNQGDDDILLGAGDDVVVWDVGDGSDAVEGQEGIDTLRFNGNSANERISLAADGDHVLLTRDVGNVTLRIGAVERIVLTGGAGKDVFCPGAGDDVVIQDFRGGADHIDLTGRGLAFDWLMDHASQVNGSTVFDLGEQQLTLHNVGLSTLHQSDFLI